MITKHPGSRSILVRPRGDLDALKSDHFRSEIRPLIHEGYRFVIFDLEATRYVTSSGLGLLVELFNWVRRSEGSLRLVNCSPTVEKLLRETRLDELLRSPDDPLPLTLPFDALHSLLSRETLFSSRLHGLTEILLACNSVEQTASHVLEGMAEACGAERGGVFLYNPESRELSLAGAIGLDASTYAAASIVSVAGDGLERTLLEAGAESSVWCINLGEPVEAPSRLQQILGFNRGILCCLKRAGRLQAFVVLAEPESTGFASEFWIPQLRLYCEISAHFLSRIHRIAQVECENAELRRQLLDAHKAHEIIVDVGRLAALGTVVSGIGHLLNNKLVPIIGYSQLLAQTEGLPEKARQQINTVGLAAGELRTVMDQLIKVSRAREISPVPTDVNTILARAVTLTSDQMEARGVKLRLQFDSRLPAIGGDQDLLLQAFLVLMHRAISSFDAGAKDKWIEIRTRVSGDNVEIIVEDNGRGLGKAPVEDWIDPLSSYMESEEGRTHNFSIPRSVVRRHSGELKLSERPGGGTIVKLTFSSLSESARLAPLGVSSHA